jgi:purine nucleoside permease
MTKDEKKALTKNKKAIASLQIAFASTYTVDAMIEATIDDGEIPQWPYGQIHLALKELYDSYRPKNRLDRIQLDIDKLTIKMADGEHSDVLSEKAMMVRKKYRRRRTKPT